jgi:hypothetical protein
MGNGTVSVLVDRALTASGLIPIAEARQQGDLARVRELSPLLETADILAVGALADRIRTDEVGDIVTVHAGPAAEAHDRVVVALGDTAGSGLAALRRVAVARIVGPRAAQVCVDVAQAGLALAQVALGFGASELASVPRDVFESKRVERLLALAARRAVFAASAAERLDDRNQRSHNEAGE